MIPADITKNAFLNTYWHRSTLTDFCRTNGLPASGSKIALTNRIAAHLSGEAIDSPTRKKRGAMPATFTADTVIGENWHCSQPLRAFFQSQTDTRFTFNKHMRDFIADGAGKTLGDALHHWHTTRNQQTKTIEPQFEYNRFMRSFFAENKGADLTAAITAWRTHRDTPKSQRP